MARNYKQLSLEERSVPGNKSAVGSIPSLRRSRLERTSRYAILVQLDEATAPVTHCGFVRQMHDVPECCASR